MVQVVHTGSFDDSDGDLAQRGIATFTQLFGECLDLWAFVDGRWHHWVDAALSPLSPELLELALLFPECLPKSPATFAQPAVDQLFSGLFRIEATLRIVGGERSEPRIAIPVVATVQTSLRRLVASLLNLDQERARLEQEVAEHRDGLMPHLEQISHDFEELTWLRRLSEQIDFCNVTDPLADLAKSILPELRGLVQAEGMVLVGAQTNEPNESSGPPKVGFPLFWCGARLLDNDSCVQITELLRARAQSGRPLVINHRELRSINSTPQNIESAIQIAVTHRGTCYGWLMAFNRNRNVPLSFQGSGSSAESLGFDEFGTSEASLMCSAAATLAAHARSAELFREREFMLIGIIRAMISAIDAKDVYTCGHSDRVATTARFIAERLGLEPIECERIYMSGLLHDIGKIGIPDNVLLKPGKLTEEEIAVIKRHPQIGHAILSHLPQLRHVLPGVLHHHETLDGTGYPHGLKGDDIPLFGRILAVADSFDAMTSDRPYRKGMPFDKAIEILHRGIGSQWDGRVVRAFEQVLPAVEVATRDSARHVRELMDVPSFSEEAHAHAQADSITRAVAAVHS